MQSKAISFKQRLEDVNGHPTGFDYMRLCLAVSVIAWHSIGTSYGPSGEDAIQGGLLRPLQALIIPMFFTLSGYLVASSLLRCRTLGMFFGLRAIRIFPALTVEVVLSALIIGPLLTAIPIAEYFTSSAFWQYFLNIPGFIHYKLPGVFLDNPQPETVNGQLWTIPFELYCYIAIGGLALFGLQRRPRLFASVIAALAVSGAIHYCYKHGWSLESRKTGMPGFTLIICFLLGALFFLISDRMPWSKTAFWFSAPAALTLLLFPPLGDFFAMIPLAYCTVYLGLCNPSKARILQGADYSYGLYLYGYVIQQSIMSLGPAYQHWYINLFFALPAAACFSAISWHVIEKPALRSRKLLVQAEENYLKWRRKTYPQTGSLT